MASAVARAYNEGLGAEPPAGSRGRAPGQGVNGALGGKPRWLPGSQRGLPPKAETKSWKLKPASRQSWSTFGFWTFNGSRKFADFSKIWKRNQSDTVFVLSLQKKSWMATKLERDLEQNWGLYPHLSPLQHSVWVYSLGGGVEICWFRPVYISVR